jgi:pilus assembly protein Flp/PilA
MTLMTHARNFLRNDEGQDLIEYALIVALIAIVCVTALTTAGSQVNLIFQSIAQKLTDAPK